MAATTTAVAAAAASVLALVGVKKVYSAITAERGLTLPSLRGANLLKCAYPEDYYPGTPFPLLSLPHPIAFSSPLLTLDYISINRRLN